MEKASFKNLIFISAVYTAFLKLGARSNDDEGVVMFDIEVIGTLVVGIGFCYMGLSNLSTNFRQMINVRFRTWLAKAFENHVLMSTAGLAFATITAKTTSLSLILSSLSSARIIPLKKTIPAIIWAVLGASLPMYLACFKITYSALIVIAIFIFLYTFNPEIKTKTVVEIGFGTLLFCFGLYILKNASSELREISWFGELSKQSAMFPHYAILAGALFAAVLEPLIVSLLTATILCHETAFNFQVAIFFISGAFVGHAWRRWMHANEQKGQAKHLLLFEAMLYAGISGKIIALVSLETAFQIPLLRYALASFASSPQMELVNFAVILSFFVILSTSMLKNQTSSLISEIAPICEKEEEGKTLYISKGALHDPESAMDLVEIEQFRLIELLPNYLGILRSADNFSKQPSLDKINNDYGIVHGEIQDFLNAFQANDLHHKTFERFLSLLHRNNILSSLERSCYVFANDASSLMSNKEVHELIEKFIEALDAVLMMITQATSTLDSSDLSLLYSVTSSREDVLAKIKKNYLDREHHLEMEERSKLLEIIVTFEKIIWLVRQFCSLLGEGRHLRVGSSNQESSKEQDAI